MAPLAILGLITKPAKALRDVVLAIRDLFREDPPVVKPRISPEEREALRLLRKANKLRQR